MSDRFYKDIEIPDVSAAVSVPAPDTGYIQLYGRNGKLAFQDSNGQETIVGSGSYIPTLVKGSEVFLVPEDTQALFMKRIRVESGGRIKVFGILVEPR